MSWQPIEAAPKPPGETPILVWIACHDPDDDYCALAYYRTTDKGAWFEREEGTGRF